MAMNGGALLCSHLVEDVRHRLSGQVLQVLFVLAEVLQELNTFQHHLWLLERRHISETPNTAHPMHLDRPLLCPKPLDVMLGRDTTHFREAAGLMKGQNAEQAPKRHVFDKVLKQGKTLTVTEVVHKEVMVNQLHTD